MPTTHSLQRVSELYFETNANRSEGPVTANPGRFITVRPDGLRELAIEPLEAIGQLRHCVAAKTRVGVFAEDSMDKWLNWSC